MNVEWIKDHFELSWKPPKNLISTNDLEYLVEMEYKPGSWKTLGGKMDMYFKVYARIHFLPKKYVHARSCEQFLY